MIQDQTVSQGLSGIPSPCGAGPDVGGKVERALSLRLQPSALAYYCSQYAGDMPAAFEGKPLELIQVWSEHDFLRVQENLIGHLLMQKRLRQTPTLFIGTTLLALPRPS